MADEQQQEEQEQLQEAEEEDGGGGEAEAGKAECGICYTAFDAGERAPKVLACLHTFCLQCLSQMALLLLRHHQGLPGGQAGEEEEEEAPLALACPLCRHRTQLPGGSAHLLPLNTKLLGGPPDSLALKVLAPMEGSLQLLERPLLAETRRTQSRRQEQEVRTIRCVCVVFTFFSLMVVSITGPLFLNYSGWVELFMVSLFLVVAIVLALFSIMPYLLRSQYRTIATAFQAGDRAPRGPPLRPIARPSSHS